MVSINFKSEKESALSILKWEKLILEEVFIEHEFIFPQDVKEMAEFETAFIRFLFRNDVKELIFKTIDKDLLHIIKDKISSDIIVKYDNIYSIHEKIGANFGYNENKDV